MMDTQNLLSADRRCFLVLRSSTLGGVSNQGLISRGVFSQVKKDANSLYLKTKPNSPTVYGSLRKTKVFLKLTYL